MSQEVKTPSVEEFEAKIADAISNSMTKNLQEAVSIALEEKMKELGMNKVDAKYANIPAHFLGVSEEELSQMDKKQRAAKFVKAVFHRDLVTLGNMKALGEGSDSAGGFLVPEEYSKEIVREAENYGIARKLCRRLPMGSDTLNMPTLSSSVSVYWPGEGAAGTESDPVFGRTKLEAKTAVGLTVLSNELLADTSANVIDFLTEIFGEALAGEEDNQLCNGTGSPFTGILVHTSVNTVTMGAGDTSFSNVTADDLRDAITQIKAGSLPGAAWVLSPYVWGIIQKLKDTTNQYISSTSLPVITPSTAESGDGLRPVGSVWGYPVYVSEKMPGSAEDAVSTKFAIFGNFKYAWLGDREEMTLKISDSATVGSNNVFEENESAVRITERVAIAVGIPNAFAVLQTAAS